MPTFDVPIDEDVLKAVIYPGGYVVAFHPTEDSILTAVSSIYAAVATAEINSGLGARLEAALAANDIVYMPVPWEVLMLVCNHAARDKRCGRAGPQVLEALEAAKEELGVSSRQVTALASSHIGGHKYAGTLITYPSGNWYGHISKSNTKALLESVLANSTPDYKCFRGCGFALLDF